MGIGDLISLLGGVALFLFGMSEMGSGIKKVAGSRMELLLYRLSSSPVRGVLLGAGVTAVIQSSSATSVMVVGFVNSGMMSVRQAINIILGAILGTSITGWLLALSGLEGAGGLVALLSTKNLTGVVAVIGIALYMFSKKPVRRNVGGLLMGFAVLMYGMQIMTAAVSPLRESELFLDMMTSFSHPLLGVLVGLIFTSVIQSASAAVGILQALALAGAIDFAVTFPMIMGIAIGAALPVLFSALGASANGKRTAFSYLIINVAGAAVLGGVFYALNAVLHFPFMHVTMNVVSVAMLNTLFRLATLLLLAPLTGQIERLVALLFPGDPHVERIKADIDRLEERFLIHPALALEQSSLTLNSMAYITRENLLAASSLVDAFSEELFRAVESTEDLIDRYEDRLGSYLVRMTPQRLTERQAAELSKSLHAIGDFERIGDHAMNIAESAKEMQDKKVRFSHQARHEMSVLSAAIEEIINLSIEAFINEDEEMAYRIEPLEETIDNLCDEMKLHHVTRLQSGDCTLTQGFVFNDLVTDYERIGDHCSNIAMAILEMRPVNMDAHVFLSSLKEQRSHDFDVYFAEYGKRFSLDERPGEQPSDPAPSL